MSEDQKQDVVELVNAGAPADQGLSSLGLLMQLAGSLFAAFAVVAAFSLIVQVRGNGGELLWVFLTLGLCGVRSIFHRMAGSDLLYGRRVLGAEAPTDYLGGLRRYIIIGFAHTALIALILVAKWGAPLRVVLAVSAPLALWPATLAVLFASPRFKRFKQEMPITEDKGFEGAAILMTVLGAVGICVATVLLLVMVQGGKSISQGPGVLFLLATIMLIIRSFIHVQAGVSGIRETSIDRSVELANRYANFGVISSFCAGGAMLLMSMATALNVLMLAFVCAFVWVLMTWPLIVRRFFSDRQFADLLAGDAAPVHRRAPDAGLTGLGWLLLATSVLFLSTTLPALIMGLDGDSRDMARMMRLFGAFSMHSPWWNVGIYSLQAWAGYELIRMSNVYKLVGSLFGVVAVVVEIYLQWPMFKMLWHGHEAFSPEAMSMLLYIVLTLIIPVTTLVLVNRKTTPTAIARFRGRKD
jgi:hypothetical protein